MWEDVWVLYAGAASMGEHTSSPDKKEWRGADLEWWQWFNPLSLSLWVSHCSDILPFCDSPSNDYPPNIRSAAPDFHILVSEGRDLITWYSPCLAHKKHDLQSTLYYTERGRRFTRCPTKSSLSLPRPRPVAAKSHVKSDNWK